MCFIPSLIFLKFLFLFFDIQADLIFISVGTPTKTFGLGAGLAPNLSGPESAAVGGLGQEMCNLLFLTLYMKCS